MELSEPDPLGKRTGLNHWLAGLPRGIQLLLALVLLTLCALTDFLTGNELSFSITYLAPIALAAWYAGAVAGYGLTIVASLVWLGIELLGGFPYSHPLIPLWNCLVRFGFFLIVTTLLLHIRHLIERLQQQADTDNLTGLANSRSFYQRLDHEHDRARRYRHPFTVAFLDLDNFKQINDTWGHKAGDWVLQSITQVLTANLRKTDLVARLGGDEFAVLLAESGEEAAREALSKLHERLREKMAEQNWPVGCSIGAITCIDPERLSTHELMQRADELMYQVKRSGKNRLELVAMPADHK